MLLAIPVWTGVNSFNEACPVLVGGEEMMIGCQVKICITFGYIEVDIRH